MSARKFRLPREIFLSHSSKDRRFAMRLATMLRDHGIPVWYAPTEIIGAQQWHDEIGSALARCDWFVLVLSPNAVRSEWVHRELLFALNHAQYRDRIAPVVFRKCRPQKLSWTLETFQHIDFSANYIDGCTQLLRVWGKGYKG